MVANIRCAEIAEEQLHALAEDQAWRALAAEAGSGLVPSFGARAAALLDSCLTGGRCLTFAERVMLPLLPKPFPETRRSSCEI
jgi:hypothetical protein